MLSIDIGKIKFCSQMSWDNLEEFLFTSWVKAPVCPQSLSLKILLVIPV